MLWLELTFQDLRILNGRGVDTNLHPKISIGTPSLMNLEVMKPVPSGAKICQLTQCVIGFY
jgi:hypothetical protein